MLDLQRSSLSFRSRWSLLFDPTGADSGAGRHGIHRVAVEEWDDAMQVVARDYRSFAVFLVVDGEGEWRLDGDAGTVPLQAGMAFCHPRSGTAAITCAASAPLAVVALELLPDRWAAVWSELIGEFGWALPLRDWPRLHGLMRLIHQEAHLQQAHVDRQLAVLVEQFLIVLARCLDRTSTGPDPGVAYAERARDMLQVDIASRRSIAEIAAEIGISQAHLARVFRQHLKMTPTRFRARVKVDRAIRLLRADPHRPLAEVADEVGFADAYSFSHAFKRVLGVSPSVYRRPP